MSPANRKITLAVWLFFLAGSCWILTTDFLLQQTRPDSVWAVSWQSGKGLIFVAGTSIFLFLILRSVVARVATDLTLEHAATLGDATDATPNPIPPPGLKTPLTIFLVLAVTLVMTGVLVHSRFAETIRAASLQNLEQMNEQALQQMESWRRERLGDAATITADAAFLGEIQNWLAARGNNPPPESVTSRLQALHSAFGYHAILLCDLDGSMVLAPAGQMACTLPGSLLTMALQAGRPLWSGIHQSRPDHPQVLDLVIPLPVPKGPPTAFFATLVLRSEATMALAPSLKDGSHPASSAETLLLQVDANHMSQTLSLRHPGAKVQPLRLAGMEPRQLLDMLPAGGHRTVSGRDHRGTPVVAALSTVPGTDNWLLIAKIDQAEIDGSLQRLTFISGSFTLFLLSIAAGGILLWWRQQQAGLAFEKLHAQIQRQMLRKHFEFIVRFGNDIIWLLDEQGRIVEANDQALAAYGYAREQLIGRDIRDLRAPGHRDDFDYLQGDATDEGVLFETWHQRADGSVFPVEVSSRRVAAEGSQWIHSIVRDISERHEAQEKIQRLTRLYNVLSQTNQAIVRLPDRQTLFEEICRVGVEVGRLRMAMITEVDPATGLLRPTAFRGPDASFPDSLPWRQMADIPPMSPTALVLQQQRPVICNDLHNDAMNWQRRDIPKRYGFQSAAVFPLFLEGQLAGTLNLYAGETGFFESDLTAVLEEMAVDISFALDNYERETARHRAEETLRKTANTLQALYQASPLPVLTMDLAGCVTFWNPAAEGLFGWTAEEVLGQPLPTVPMEFKEEFFSFIARGSRGEALSGLEVQRQRRDGSRLDLLLFSAPLLDDQQQVTGIMALLMDITEQKKARQHIIHLAHYDQLTGLANRTLLRQRFDQEAAHAQREGRQMALCLLDIDQFKLVNDALGHPLGDKLLCQVARRLENQLRRIDLVCRPGGDEFLLLLTDLDQPQNCARVAQKILGCLGASFSLDGHTFRISASMGISLYPGDGIDIDTLFKNADTAMYAAKQKGRNSFLFFQEDMNRKIQHRLLIESSLRSALGGPNLFLHYQPQLDTVSGRVLGAEALLRFRHPRLGLVPPDEFIPIAEESGLIVPMGYWLLGEACRQLRSWHNQGLRHLTMAVNLSVVQVLEEDFVERLAAIMLQHGIDPGQMTLELTESIFMEEDSRIARTLTNLKTLGVHLSLDDFGTGYSSLSYLKRYAVDEIKIDRAFVRDVCSDPSDAAIVRATLQMAHSLGLVVVAEGVETVDQLEFLQQFRCDHYQGFLFSKPLPGEDFFPQLQSRGAFPDLIA